MKPIKLRLTFQQAKALLQITQAQLFNVKYLDPRIPGYQAQPDELAAAESAVKVLEAAVKEHKLATLDLWLTPIRHGAIQNVK